MRNPAIYFSSIITLVIFSFSVESCIKPPAYPIEPVITFDSISATNVTQADSVKIKIDFTDGDGDMGVKQGETTPNFFMVDSRKGFIYNFLIPYVEPKGNVKAISGNFVYTNPGITLTPGHLIDTLHYDIYIYDRAGHKSNIVSTPDIYVTQ